MPASMMSAATGLRLKVIGSSMAIVATGPTPGSTPISVPSMTPISAYSRWIGVNATPKPRARFLKISMSMARFLSADRAGVHERRADRERQREAFDEYQHGEHDQDEVQDRDFLPLELVAAVGADEHQREGGEDQPERFHEVAVDYARHADQDQRAELELRHRRPGDGERAEQHDAAEHRHQSA